MSKENNKKKIIVLVAIVLALLLLVVGVTYAYLTFGANVTNGNYSGTVECFVIDYDPNNDIDATDATHIVGTMFPSATIEGGLSGMLGVGIDSSCNVSGSGKIILRIYSSTSTLFGTSTSKGHCEDSTTLETLPEYTTNTACTAVSGTTWETSGTGALKFAVFDPDKNAVVAATRMESAMIGHDIVIHTFDVTSEMKYFYVFAWLDGYISDNSYTDLTFGGELQVEVVQK